MPVSSSPARSVFTSILLVLASAVPAIAQSQGPSVEGCIGCHALGEPAPVGNISSLLDLHYIDTDPRGPAAVSGYRQLNVAPSSTDVSGASVVVVFEVTDENGAAVANVFDTDGTLVLARLVDQVDPMDPDTAGDPKEWRRLVSEGFTNGTFEYLGAGVYRYTSAFDPTTDPVLPGETFRAAIELSASDIPAGNGWCDFDADGAMASLCGTATLTRDIVRTDTCNGCHGVTSDVKLSFHRNGGRTEMEYCVVCHTPDRNPDTGMTLMTHKIHYGANLTQEYRGGTYNEVQFTREVDDCTGCHEQGPVDADNWRTQPTREACGSCHDDVNFENGLNHGSGGQQLTDRFCTNCHPPEGVITTQLLPVPAVHRGMARNMEASLYRGAGNGLAIESATYDRVAETITVVFSSTRDGVKQDLATDPLWSNGARIAITVGWSAEEYTNEGSGSDPAPAQPLSINGLDIGGVIEDLGDGSYRTVIDVSGTAFGSATVGLEGHPQADLREIGEYSQVPVKSQFVTLSVEQRAPVQARRAVVDIGKCNACHDSGGAGLAFHGTNRTGEMQVCVVCHNGNATDLRQRPADPGDTTDGKREESIDMKRMIHQIHMGGDLEEPVVIYGFGGREHDYASVNFIGNNANCLTCHVGGSYSTDDAWHTLPSTIDTGPEVTDPSDDLKISPVTAVCSGCHDTERAKDHMVANGGTFGSLPDEIATPAPEPGASLLSAAALGALSWLARRRRGARDLAR